MRLLALRHAIIDTIKEALPELSAVDAHPGRFNLDELRRIATKLPAVRVAIMAFSKVVPIQTGERQLTVKLAAFVMTSDRRKLPKDESALAIVEALLTLIPGHRWTLSAVSGATDAKAENLFSGRVDKQGVAMWAITWQQVITVGEDIWQGGVLPSEVYVCNDPNHFGEEDHYLEVSDDGSDFTTPR
ncbi:hypothetical protein CS022_22475 [Veronia nyctiphanis]|uniref:Uncharacterized protein n=1 Tax=Veronia nyctiphanis TaxID=1278244 RepID=A0A4Q0YJA9_9GAMM|nr:phage protein Gp37 [Veronia nyctiphanis]RXJ70790.1 hypothetical protein CS022_22475 [Veronia nyctiphanis]